MKNLGKGLLLLSVLTLGLSSCSDESPWQGSDSEGAINLNLSSDSRVMRQTRSDDTTSPIVPDVSLFSVNLAKSDGSYSQTWQNLESFNRETAFPIGEYAITASFGKLDKEGFEHPYYTGSTNVHVAPGASTDANIVATLANSMVSIRYTEDFKQNFLDYHASVQSEGHDQVVFARDEDRPAYICPSKVKLNISLTNQSGQEVTIQPAQFTAQPRHHYVVTIGVEGLPNGVLGLDVQFDEDVVNETVEVSLTDELFTAPAPSLKPLGFSANETLESIEYTPRTAKTAFDIFAFGSLKSVTFSVIGEGYEAPFGNSVELVNATASTQQSLANAGVDCAGLFKNVDKLAQVNVTDYLSKLPAGNYTLEVQAVDLMTRTTDPLAFNFKVEPLQFDLSVGQEADFLGDELAVDVTTNSADIRDRVTFKVPNAKNQMIPATIKSVNQVTAATESKTRSGESICFRYVLEIEPQIRDLLDVQATVNGMITKDINVPMAIPEFSLVPDAFARKVVIKLTAEDASKQDAILDNLVFFNGSSVIPTSSISVSGNIITIVGLNPNVAYNSLKAKLGNIEKDVTPFTTEKETDVTNGDFSSLGSAITFNKINVGGLYNVKFIFSEDYQNYSNISYQEPTGWATVNENTCWSGSNPLNTWFVTPSTYAESGAVVLRSVGYNHNGTIPATSGGSGNTNYYCENAPTDAQFNKAAGELFLGSYSFDGSEHRTDGISFTSRPSSLSFNYKYIPLEGSGEQAEVYVRLYDSSNNVIAEKTELLSQADMAISKTIDITGYPFGKKAAKIVLGFRSTKSGVTPKISIPSGSDLNEGIINIRGDRMIATNEYHALATGSVLTVDNVKLGYGTSSASSAKPAKKSGRK